jgi:hypothetical protein
MDGGVRKVERRQEGTTKRTDGKKGHQHEEGKEGKERRKEGRKDERTDGRTGGSIFVLMVTKGRTARTDTKKKEGRKEGGEEEGVGGEEGRMGSSVCNDSDSDDGGRKEGRTDG